ncbi:GON-4-like protein isoform X3 [Nematostella vectensis]|uniref:GON-4-like protein isoform X3 n=1 Tax=Nematostella vectensis TaxID=45351 RepID=UPI0020778FB3|nr:GON-4-like protein isoform X3 [Nematostella vectensis]
MPNTPKEKKRKVGTKSGREVKPKRLRFDGNTSPTKKSKANSRSRSDTGKKKRVQSNKALSAVEEDGCSGQTGEELSLERVLEENAEKHNLTATNVKNILHRIIKDDQFHAMVRQAVEQAVGHDEEQDEDSSTKTDKGTDFLPLFEPKLTRAKRKETNQQDPIAKLTNSPAKKPVPQSMFYDLEFPESSSDEEYQPDGEESEDTESYVSQLSDLASPGRAGSPDSMNTDDTPSCSPQVGRPLTRHRSQEMTFKEPLPVSSGTPAKADLIAKRTRSHVQAIEEPIDDSMLPDFMPDLYDTLCEDDLDKDDIQFQMWLQGLLNENGDLPDEDTEEDMEYNFMAENLKEEKEEYRNDRAVRIPKKEVDELFQELLAQFGEDDDDDYSAGSFRSMLLSELEEPKGPLFTPTQWEQLHTQMWQHTQLLTQIYLMSREDPTLQQEASVCKQYINELQGFSDRATSAHLIMALGGGDLPESAFSTHALPEAYRIVNEPYKAPKSPSKIKPRGKALKAGKEAVRNTPLSQTNMETMCTHSLFKYKKILPHFTLFPNDPTIPSDKNKNLRVKFTEAEDCLLAMGMKQFNHCWEVIRDNLLPVKDPKQLQIRAKNLSAARAPDNIVKHLKKTKALWKIPSEITAVVWIDGRLRELEEPNWLKKQTQKALCQAKGKPQRKAPSVVSSSPSGNATVNSAPPGSTTPIVNSSPHLTLTEAEGSFCPKPDNPKEPDKQDQMAKSNLTSPQENAPTPTESQIEAVSSPKSNNTTATTSGKGKGFRDKPAIPSILTARTQSTSSETAPSNAKKVGTNVPIVPRTYILEPDPQANKRAQAFAEGYLEKVRSALLKSYPEIYESFLKTLVDSSMHGWSPVQLYKRMEAVLLDFPELIENFIAFLEPDQAVLAEVSMKNLQFVKARTFFRKLEVHFRSTPSHFKKIMSVFNGWNPANKMPRELHEKITPLLRGQAHLVEEFNSFFDDMKPPACSDEDFEEVEMGSGSEMEFDGFEEIVIPKEFKTVKTMRVSQEKTVSISREPAHRDAQRKHVRRIKPGARRDLSDDEAAKKDDGDDDHSKDYDGSLLTKEKESADCPYSTTPSAGPESGNHISKEHEHSTKRRTNSRKKGKLDGGNKSEEKDNLEYLEKHNGEGDYIDSDDDGENDDNNEEVNITNDDKSPTRRVSAMNHGLAHDGQLVVLWTREADRDILQTCQELGSTQDTFIQLAKRIAGKTPEQVENRFEDLMSLFQSNISTTSQMSANERSSSEDETGTSDTDNDSRQ